MQGDKCMAYSLDSLQDDCYENTLILKNKFDIRDEKALDEIEQTITAINSAEIELNMSFENVNFDFYKNIHKIMFEDIYDWAGKIRTVNISKKGTNFCEFKNIEEVGNNCFKRLNSDNLFTNISLDDFIDKLTEFYCEINMLHPFREGNGRVQRLFLSLLIKNAGYEICFSKIDVDLLMIATIKSVSGDIFLLKDVLGSNIVKIN
jgi:cell filamentation protein